MKHEELTGWRAKNPGTEPKLTTDFTDDTDKRKEGENRYEWTFRCLGRNPDAVGDTEGLRVHLHSLEKRKIRDIRDIRG
jgi:hypothetical protein